MPGWDNRDSQLRSAQPFPAPWKGTPCPPASEQPRAVGRATLSMAGFVMLQLHARCLSPPTYSSLCLLSFCLSTNQTKTPIPGSLSPDIIKDIAECGAYPPRPTPATFKRSAYLHQPLCLTERCHTHRAAAGARLSPLPASYQGWSKMHSDSKEQLTLETCCLTSLLLAGRCRKE